MNIYLDVDQVMSDPNFKFGSITRFMKRTRRWKSRTIVSGENTIFELFCSCCGKKVKLPTGVTVL